MVDLLDELEKLGEVDEENFIFIDEHGKAELKQEVIFRWNGFPNKKLHLTFNTSYSLFSDSISYVKTLLCVAMEKYSIFNGLKNLKIIDLSIQKDLLPEVILISERQNR